VPRVFIQTPRSIVARSTLATLATLLLTAAAPSGQARPQHRILFPPENLGELEGADRDTWQRSEQIMDVLGIAEGSVVADLGAGSGWFTVRLARRVWPNGKVYAEDIQPQMVEVIKRRRARENLERVIEVRLGTAEDLRLPENSLDAALICDAYHEMEQPVALLRNAARALKQDGRLAIIEFTKAGGGPGPPMENRVDPERVIREAQAAGLQLIARPNIIRYQYMLVFGKPAAAATRAR
jgi:ubiquinone/menaquinone biosynthesis C-methylase UbiE